MKGTGRVKNQPVIKHKSRNTYHGNNAFTGPGTRLPGFEPQLCVLGLICKMGLIIEATSGDCYED